MSQFDLSFAENLQSARKAQNLSLDQLSRRSGVSKSMLRQIEIGRSSPTISVLWKIANGLRVPFSSLLTRKRSGAQVTDFQAQAAVKADEAGYRLFPMVLFQPDRPVEIYYAELDAGVRFEGEPHQGNARETVFVLRGGVELTVAGVTSTARESQFLQFAAGEPHSYFNPETVTARLIMTIDYAL